MLPTQTLKFSPKYVISRSTPSVMDSEINNRIDALNGVCVAMKLKFKVSFMRSSADIDVLVDCGLRQIFTREDCEWLVKTFSSFHYIRCSAKYQEKQTILKADWMDETSVIFTVRTILKRKGSDVCPRRKWTINNNRVFNLKVRIENMVTTHDEDKVQKLWALLDRKTKAKVWKSIDVDDIMANALINGKLNIFSSMWKQAASYKSRKALLVNKSCQLVKQALKLRNMSIFYKLMLFASTNNKIFSKILSSLFNPDEPYLLNLIERKCNPDFLKMLDDYKRKLTNKK